MKTFRPDVIVEVTRACDRQCKGCYAPNILIGSSISSEILAEPGLFLDATVLAQKLAIIATDEEKVNVTSIRGGEPSTHPNLPDLINVVSKHSKNIYIETHGRWLDPVRANQHTNAIIQACRDTGAILKISFDRMHGLSGTKLRAILDYVESNQIRWCVAVTENSLDEAKVFLSQYTWLHADKIFLQIKAKRASDLVKPTIAVIASDGNILLSVTSRWQVSTNILEDKI